MCLMFNSGEDRFQSNTGLFSQVCALSSLLFCILHGLCNSSNLFAQAAYHTRNHTGFLFGTFGQTANVCCNGAKAFAIFSGHGGLDGGIECQTICLMGDTRNDIDDFVNLTGTFVQSMDLAGSGLNVFVDPSHALNGLPDCLSPCLRILACDAGDTV